MTTFIRSTHRRVAAVGVAALALVAGSVPGAAGADPTRPRLDLSARSTPGAPDSAADRANARVCMSRLGALYAPSVPAQNFESQFDRYDSELADDFRVDRRCRARSLYVVPDTWSGAGDAESATVAFYRDGGARPGKVIWERNVEAVGSYIELTMPIDPPVRLRPGRDYWVSVQLDMDFADQGQIGLTTTPTGDPTPLLWRNPGDGFETGCTDWAPAADCTRQPDVGSLRLEITNRFDPTR